MQRNTLVVGAAVVALSLLVSPIGRSWAGESSFSAAFGGSFFSGLSPCPAKQLPTFESLVPVPQFIDPFEQDLIPVFCQIQISREGKGVKKVKGKYEAELVVRDNNTGQLETFSIGQGKFRTNNSGSDTFDFDLPAEIFADGFESGDVSAWSYTRTDFTNKKKTDNASVVCDTQAGGTQ